MDFSGNHSTIRHECNVVSQSELLAIRNDLLCPSGSRDGSAAVKS